VKVRTLREALEGEDDDERAVLLDSGATSGPMISLNAAMATDGVLVTIAEGIALEKPVHIVHVATRSSTARYTRSFLTVATGARATLLESFVAAEGAQSYQVNDAVAVCLGERAELQHVRLMVDARISYKLFWIMREEGIWDMSRIDELIARNSEAQTGCPVTYTYTDESIRTLLAGFDVIDVRKAHIFTWDVDAYRRYEYVKASEWANVNEAALAALERELGWHLLVRAVPAELLRR